jgi:4-hydroxybenzoate polyprenyltransferase
LKPGFILLYHDKFHQPGNGMISRSSLAHIRVPVSFFLMPVFFLALFSAGHIDPVKAWTVFFVLHFLLYPASNGFNSYYDRDFESIGTLKHPPAVTRDLLWLSLALDAAACTVAFFAGPLFALGCFIYGCASKAYSWDKTRIKKHALAGWLFTGLGQGTLTFLLVAVSVGDAPVADINNFRLWFPALACGLFVSGFYPLTQVFQHREDGRRHDRTISMLVGTQGTFYLASIVMFATILLFSFYFALTRGIFSAAAFCILLVPAVVYFTRWLYAVRKNTGAADYDRATRMSVLASSGINLFSLLALFSVIK